MLTLSYFSYKGGSGRSSLAYNTLPFIAEKLNATPEHPIIVVDLDIDSAGLSILLCGDKLKKGDLVPPLTTDRLLDSEQNPFAKHIGEPAQADPKFTNLDTYKRFINVGFELGLESNPSVLFVPIVPGQNIRNTFNMNSTDVINEFVRMCRNYGARAVIFDTPAGDQVVARGAINASDVLLVCLRITKQHREGTADFLDRKLRDIGGRKVVIVPNAVPNIHEDFYIDGIKYNFQAVKESMISRYKTIVDNSDENEFIGDMLENGYYGIPEVKRFRFQEGILYDIKKRLRPGVSLMEDEERAYDAYEHLADIVTKF